jgi:hypothetical protein
MNSNIVFFGLNMVINRPHSKRRKYGRDYFCKYARIGKTFTLKFIIQRLSWLYNKGIYSYVTKIKVLLMTSIGKATFNIDGLMIHLTLNVNVQQSLFNLPNQ